MSGNDYSKQAQDYYSLAPTIILGSGASAAFNMSGMWDLAQHLKTHVDVTGFQGDELAEWLKFCALLDDNTDLETALYRVTLSDELTRQVVINTWELINPEDLGVFNRSIKERSFFPLGHLIQSMFKSALPQIDIITTNYDRLAEYACDQEGLHHHTGFSYGYRRKLVDGKLPDFNRTVNIWKVHGSLDWLKSTINETCAFGNLASMPEGFTPQIVTPGTEKYRITHLEPFRTIIGKADLAIQNANSYLCVGFGFNDQHIQEKLIQKCVRDNISLTVITYALTDAAKLFLFDSGVGNYLAIERGEKDDQSVVYSSLYEEPIVVEGDYWSLNGYLNLIL